MAAGSGIASLLEAADSLAKASTPEPWSASRSSNWIARGGGLPPYIQHISHDLAEKRGMSESRAIQMAIGIVKRWARGGGNVDAGTRAAAAKAVAEWEALKAKSAAKSAVQHSDEFGIPTLADELAVREAALGRVAVLEAQFGEPGLLALLVEAASGVPCPHCGREVAVVKPVPNMGTKMPKVREHDCLAEAESRKLKCPKCDTVQSASNKTCSKCGHDLADARKAKFAKMQEAEAGGFATTLKRVPSATSERERLDVEHEGQTVGTIARRPQMDPGRGDRWYAKAVNGEQIAGGYDSPLRSKDEALGAIRTHLAEAPGRVMQAGSKFLVARPNTYGPTSYTEHPNESAARHAAGLPPSSTSPERSSQVAKLGEMLVMDLQTISGVDVPPLARVQEARRRDPFELAEAFRADELRDFRGRWRGGGVVRRHLTPAQVPGMNTRAVKRPKAAAQTRYEGGVMRASARARAAHAAKPQIAPKDLPGSVGSHRSADETSRKLLAQQQRDGGQLIKDVAAGKALDTEHAHRVRNADGSLGAYTAERKALHEQIISALLQGKQTHSGSARAIFTAGGPASGKSGLEKFGMLTLPHDVVHANPDTIREMLPEYKALVAAGRQDASSLTHEEASHLAKVVTRIALGRQHHILVDTVGDSGPGKFRDKILAAQEAGHKVSVHYATTSVDEAIKRAGERAKKTGRHVPEGYLRDSHRSVSQIFHDEIQHIPGIHLQVVDTTDRPNKVIAERAPKGDSLVIRDGMKFRRFIAKRKG